MMVSVKTGNSRALELRAISSVRRRTPPSFRQIATFRRHFRSIMRNCEGLRHEVLPCQNAANSQYRKHTGGSRPTATPNGWEAVHWPSAKPAAGARNRVSRPLRSLRRSKCDAIREGCRHRTF